MSVNTHYFTTVSNEEISELTLPPLKDSAWSVDHYKTFGTANIGKIPQEELAGEKRVDGKTKFLMFSKIAEAYEKHATQESDPALRALYLCKAKEILEQNCCNSYWSFETENDQEKKVDELTQKEALACIETGIAVSDPKERALWFLRAARAEKSEKNFAYKPCSKPAENACLERASELWEKAGDAFSDLNQKLNVESLFLDQDDLFCESIQSSDNVAAICYSYAAQALSFAYLQREEKWGETGEQILKLYRQAVESKQKINSEELSSWKKAILTESIANIYQRMFFIVKEKGDKELEASVKDSILTMRFKAAALFSEVKDMYIRGHVLLRGAVNLRGGAFYSSTPQEKVKNLENAFSMTMEIWKKHKNMINNEEFYPNKLSIPSHWMFTLAGRIAEDLKEAKKALSESLSEAIAVENLKEEKN